MHLLSNTIQPELLTLLNSTSAPPLSPLFRTQINRDLPTDSFICCLSDSSQPPTHPPHKPIATSKLLSPSPLAFVPRHSEKGGIVHQVVHIQSPNIQSTFIQAGGRASSFDRKGKGKAMEPLGVDLDWLGMQVRRLGGREFAFEIGLVDAKGREGVVRFSTFAHSPKLHLPLKPNSPPLLHIPLTLPPPSSPTSLTPWLQLTIHLPSLLPMFQNHALLEEPPVSDDDEYDEKGATGGSYERLHPRKPKISVDKTLPPIPRKVSYYHKKLSSRGQNSNSMMESPGGNVLGFVSYFRVYANCRLRRIWFSKEGGAWMGNGVKDEFGLYAAEL